ncbi:2-acylglycerol O-acyltransferase 2-B-like [Crotalus adamanteus]|uniref:Acyltransferase n=1 Tax=Crotalus adamanteus TaxID=8729 RepID=A0AAW1B3F6_CROAD
MSSPTCKTAWRQGGTKRAAAPPWLAAGSSRRHCPSPLQVAATAATPARCRRPSPPPRPGLLLGLLDFFVRRLGRFVVPGGRRRRLIPAAWHVPRPAWRRPTARLSAAGECRPAPPAATASPAVAGLAAAWAILPGAQPTLAAPCVASFSFFSAIIAASASSFSSGSAAGPSPVTWAPCVTSPADPAATAAAAVTASKKRKRDNKASTFSFNCTLLLGPAALGNGPLWRLLSRPDEPAYTDTPWKKTNYSPGVAGLTLHNCWISGEAIDELHEKYLEKLTQLFEEHKAKYGLPQNKYLMIT